jgi:hypothetical protein
VLAEPRTALETELGLGRIVVLAAFGATQPATDAFTTDFRVQNLGASDATIVVAYYNQDGSTAASGLVTLPAGGKDNLVAAFNDNSNLATPFVGSAVLSSDQRIVAIGLPRGFFADFTAFASAAYDSLDASAAGTTLLFPSVACNFSGRTTTFYVQNTSPTATASCSVAYTANAAGQSAAEVRDIAPNGVGIFDQRSDQTPGLGCETLGGGGGTFSGTRARR